MAPKVDKEKPHLKVKMYRTMLIVQSINDGYIEVSIPQWRPNERMEDVGYVKIEQCVIPPEIWYRLEIGYRIHVRMNLRMEYENELVFEEFELSPMQYIDSEWVKVDLDRNISDATFPML